MRFLLARRGENQRGPPRAVHRQRPQNQLLLPRRHPDSTQVDPTLRCLGDKIPHERVIHIRPLSPQYPAVAAAARSASRARPDFKRRLLAAAALDRLPRREYLTGSPPTFKITICDRKGNSEFFAQLFCARGMPYSPRRLVRLVFLTRPNPATPPRRFTMNRPLRALPLIGLSILACAFAFTTNTRSAQAYPKPSSYPISWQLKFEHSVPHRIVFLNPGDPAPKAYWYITYSVTNLTDQEEMFLPSFDMLTKEGKVIPSEKTVPPGAFDDIKRRERNPQLLPLEKVSGKLLIGEDQTREGVAIWPESSLRMGTFHIFIAGLCGEAVIMKDGEETQVKDWTKVSEQDRESSNPCS